MNFSLITLKSLQLICLCFLAAPSFPPAPNLPNILNNIDCPSGALQKAEELFFQYLSLAEEEASAVDDFTAHILRTLDYDIDGRMVCRWRKMSFCMSGQSVEAKADLCVKNKLDYFLLVQSDKVSTGSIMSSQIFQRFNKYTA